MCSNLRGRALFDASSLIQALKLKRVDVLYGNYTQQLAIYEVLNAIWKEVYLVKSISLVEAKRLVEVFIKVLNYLKILSIHSYETEILERAAELGLTAYDASYIVLAQKNDLILITEDERLREKAKRSIRALSIEELIHAMNT